MNYRTIAQMIPAEYRSEILLTNMINTAQAHAGDRSMVYLVTIWKNYLEPDLDMTCGQCYSRVLASWKTIVGELIVLERESNLLNYIDSPESKSDKLLRELQIKADKDFEKL